MRRTMIGVVTTLACLAGAGLAPSARACGYRTPSPLARFLAADCVVVGQVTDLERDLVSAPASPGAKARTDYQVAVVKVVRNLKGAEGLTHVRIGVAVHQVPRRGQEAIYFLTEHPTESFFHMPNFYDYPINKDNEAAFAQQVNQFQLWARLWADPDAGLQSRDAGERFLTAALLLTHYRTAPRGVPAMDRTERPIDAVRSERILHALAEADWSKAAPDFRLTPRVLFAQLGARDRDGWKTKAFKTAQEFEVAAKRWLKENSSSFRITTLRRG